MPTQLSDRDGWRYAALRRIYEVTEGNELAFLSFPEVAKEVGCPDHEMPTVFQYLVAEGLLKIQGIGPTRPCSITHSGVIEIEESIRRPTRETEHFTTTVIQHYHGTVGAVQYGTSNSASVEQNSGREFSMVELIESLRRQIQQLPPERRDTALEHLSKLATICTETH